MKDNQVASLDVINAAKIVFEAACVKGSRLALALDKIYQKHVGYSALEVGEVKVYLTPAEIGEHLGMTASQVNQILAEAGYQHMTPRGWEASRLGEPYAKVDTGDGNEEN